LFLYSVAQLLLVIAVGLYRRAFRRLGIYFRCDRPNVGQVIESSSRSIDRLCLGPPRWNQPRQYGATSLSPGTPSTGARSIGGVLAVYCYVLDIVRSPSRFWAVVAALTCG